MTIPNATEAWEKYLQAAAASLQDGEVLYDVPRIQHAHKAGYRAGQVAVAADAQNLKTGMGGNSKFADGYRTACNDIAARARAGELGTP